MFTYLLSLFVIPHGITDIIVSYETNTYYQMSLMYLLAPFTSIFMNKPLYKLSFLLTACIKAGKDPDAPDIRPSVTSAILCPFF